VESALQTVEADTARALGQLEVDVTRAEAPLLTSSPARAARTAAVAPSMPPFAQLASPVLPAFVLPVFSPLALTPVLVTAVVVPSGDAGLGILGTSGSPLTAPRSARPGAPAPTPTLPSDRVGPGRTQAPQWSPGTTRGDEVTGSDRSSKRPSDEIVQPKTATARPAPPRQARGGPSSLLDFVRSLAAGFSPASATGGASPPPLVGVAALISYLFLVAPGIGRRIRLARELSPRGRTIRVIDRPG
jgi:hypothetical protein